MDLVIAYITAATKDEALRLARTLVAERLAACANILDGVTSVYQWQGVVEEASEVVLIVKTRHALFERLTERVRTLHSYDTPCVVEIVLGRGNPDYLDWLRAETADPQ